MKDQTYIKHRASSVVPRKKLKKNGLVSIVILTHNGKKDTLEFIKSLQRTTYKNYEIVLVDNASTDGTLQAVRKKFPYVRTMRNEGNLGFAAGMNTGIRVSKGHYIITVDNDRYIQQPEWLTLLVRTAESDSNIGVVVPTLVYYGTYTIQSVALVAPHIFTKITSTNYCLAMNKEDNGQFTEPFDCVGGNGLYRRDMLKEVGLLDEKMFRYFEETDICTRAKNAGWRVLAQPKSKMWHKGSVTINPTSYISVFENYKNKLRYILKNFDPFTKALALGFNIPYYLYLAAMYALKGRSDLGRAMLDAMVWNWDNRRDYTNLSSCGWCGDESTLVYFRNDSARFVSKWLGISNYHMICNKCFSDASDGRTHSEAIYVYTEKVLSK